MVFLKKFLILSLSFLAISSCKTIQKGIVTYPCGRYWDTKKEILDHKYTIGITEFIDLKPREVIADIGAGTMNWEGVFTVFTDSLSFYCEDISDECTNQLQAKKVLNHYASISNKDISSTIQTVIGTEKSTNLPSNFFDKVLIINTFHEFTDRNSMLAEIKRILKKGGKVYIEERLPTSKMKIHQGCKMPMIGESEMIEMMSNADFIFISKRLLLSPVSNQIYCFEKQ
jgi:ubiquinone/menaquinone biosynthesis C-methylase UbiE